MVLQWWRRWALWLVQLYVRSLRVTLLGITVISNQVCFSNLAPQLSTSSAACHSSCCSSAAYAHSISHARRPASLLWFTVTAECRWYRTAWAECTVRPYDVHQSMTADTWHVQFWTASSMLSPRVCLSVRPSHYDTLSKIL